MNIGVLLRQTPPKLRDKLLVKSYQFESTYNKLRAITHAYLNSDKSWIANDSRSDTKESDLKEVDYSGKVIGKDRGKRTAKEQGNGKSKGKKWQKMAKEQSPTNKTNRAACAKGSHFARERRSRRHQDKTVSEVEGAKVNADTAKRVCVHD